MFSQTDLRFTLSLPDGAGRVAWDPGPCPEGGGRGGGGGGRKVVVPGLSRLLREKRPVLLCAASVGWKAGGAVGPSVPLWMPGGGDEASSRPAVPGPRRSVDFAVSLATARGNSGRRRWGWLC